MEDLGEKVQKLCWGYIREHDDGHSVNAYHGEKGIIINCKGVNRAGKIYDLSSVTIRDSKITCVKDLEGGFLEKYLEDFNFELPKKQK